VSCSPSCQTFDIFLGPEFQVNTATVRPSQRTDVAVLPSGEFLVVWEDVASFATDVQAQLHDAAGARIGSEFQINTFSNYNEYQARVALAGPEAFVVVWTALGLDGYGNGLAGQLVDAVGTLVGSEFQINTVTMDGGQYFPDVTGIPGGGFVVAWTQLATGEVLAQRFDSAAGKLGTEVQVSPTSIPFFSSYNFQVRVAARNSADFLVVWADADGDGAGAFGRRFDSTGFPLGSEFQVNTVTVGYQVYPSVGSNGSDGFVVAWANGSGFPDSIFARRYASDGSAIGTEFRVDTAMFGLQANPEVHVASDGQFVVTWRGGYDGFGDGAFARRFNSDASPLSPAFQVNSFTQGVGNVPAIDGLLNRNFVITWPNSIGYASNIFGQRFIPSCGNGIVETWETCDPPNGSFCLPNCQGAP
jgi:hypothetical protein